MKPRLRSIFARLIGLCWVLSPPAGFAQRGSSKPSPDYVQLGKPDQAEGARILEEFRGQGIAGPYYLQFDLNVLPRNGPEKTYRAEMWGLRNEMGPLTRVGLKSTGANAPSEQRLLLQNGPKPAVWVYFIPGQSTPVQTDAEGLFKPLFDTNLTAFDLQMPFLYWSDFVYEGLARILGRPAHKFLLYPPPSLASQHPELTGVRVYLDTQFNALVEAELIGAKNRILKSISVLDLKKVGDQWLVRSIDVRDETSRDKTRFLVTAAALNLNLSPRLFEPARLAEAMETPPQTKIINFK